MTKEAYNEMIVDLITTLLSTDEPFEVDIKWKTDTEERDGKMYLIATEKIDSILLKSTEV